MQGVAVAQKRRAVGVLEIARVGRAPPAPDRGSCGCVGGSDLESERLRTAPSPWPRGPRCGPSSGPGSAAQSGPSTPARRGDRATAPRSRGTSCRPGVSCRPCRACRFLASRSFSAHLVVVVEEARAGGTSCRPPAVKTASTLTPSTHFRPGAGLGIVGELRMRGRTVAELEPHGEHVPLLDLVAVGLQVA